jgi:hypothetical protein
MATQPGDALVGLFDDARMADAAVQELRRAGFADDQIGVVSRDRGEEEAPSSICALLGPGVPEEEARSYDSAYQAGRVLVTVRPRGRANAAYAILHRYGAFGSVSTAPRGATAGI